MSRVTRGFLGRNRTSRDPRLPPGQYDVGADFPVLTAEVTPHIELEAWTFTIDGLASSPRSWTWGELRKMPESTYEGDIHCVTTWSKLGTRFSGVSLDSLLAEAEPLPEARHVL